MSAADDPGAEVKPQTQVALTEDFSSCDARPSAAFRHSHLGTNRQRLLRRLITTQNHRWSSQRTPRGVVPTATIEDPNTQSSLSWRMMTNLCVFTLCILRMVTVLYPTQKRMQMSG